MTLRSFLVNKSSLFKQNQTGQSIYVCITFFIIWFNTVYSHVLVGKINPQYDIFKELNILKLRDVHKLNRSTFLYKFVYITLPVPLLRLYIYIMEIHMTTWWDTALILKHQQRTQEIMQHSFLYKGSSLWLTLADRIKSSKTIFTFKKHITLSLISSY